VLAGCSRTASLREALATFPRVVATTSTRDRRLAVPLVGPRELPARLAADPPATPVALVFGPEVGGLTNDELACANLVVSIPCAPSQPTLNLAQAVLILAYEIYQARLAEVGAEAEAGSGGGGGGGGGSGEPPATSAEVEALFDHAATLLRRIGFERDTTFPGVLRDLRAAAARACLSRRETAVLHGICRRAGHALAAPGRRSAESQGPTS